MHVGTVPVPVGSYNYTAAVFTTNVRTPIPYSYRYTYRDPTHACKTFTSCRIYQVGSYSNHARAVSELV